jgi:hypothetical protein
VSAQPPRDEPAAPPPDDPPSPQAPLAREPRGLVPVAYLMALVTLLAPLAVLGAVFAGVVLARRGRPATGAGVIAVGAACVVLGLTVVW